jgi:hypothetical protein
MAKNRKLKGSQSLAQERMINEIKLRGGPGRTGTIHPRRPMSAKHNPMRSMKSVTASNSKPLYGGRLEIIS